jgi:hypothetical protein
MTIGRRLGVSVIASIALNFCLASWAASGHWLVVAPEHAGVTPVRIDEFIVPVVKPKPTPPPHWERLDRSAIRYQKILPDHLQVVIAAPRQSNGEASDAPAVYRVDISPPRVRSNELLHIRAFTSPDANGVYVRFAIWELAVDPVGPGRFPPTDPDYPGQVYELFERDYLMPRIPPFLVNRSYSVLFAATGRGGLASGAYVPLYLEATR